ncbi:MAG TPA: sigma-70 family RNA polymerase sigma factor [Chloroflexota bacterium]|nr:sigma-70 family RNA polymerase sigma factor [Chloroflexota bacterium]
MENSEPDEVLAVRARDSREAFGTLYERHLRRIYNYIYYRTGNAADAEDLTSRTFFQAMNNIHRYQVQAVPFSAWLFRIAHNLVANWHRDSGRHRATSIDTEYSLLSDDDGPHDVAEAGEERRELHQAVRVLAADRQQLLILKYSEGLSNDEIAVIMGRSEGAVKALLHRTVKGLRDELMRSKRDDQTKGAKS